MAEEEILFHPDECLGCQHFYSDTWSAKPIVSFCFGFGERRKVNMGEVSSEPCPKPEPRGGGNRY